jgi:hypothetical protein
VKKELLVRLEEAERTEEIVSRRDRVKNLVTEMVLEAVKILLVVILLVRDKRLV